MTWFAMRMMTSPKLAAVGAQADAIGLIPLGAVEQHGPHLPVATDCIIAERLAEEVASRLPGPVVTAPVLPFGMSAHHLGFPGTVDVPEDVLAACVRAYVDALRQLGLTRIAIFSAHGGNFGCLLSVEREYADTPGLTVLTYSDFDRYVEVMAAGARTAGVDVSPVDTHAGGLETSQMLALLGGAGLSPDRLPDGFDTDGPEWRERIAAGGLKAVTDNGVLGSPKLATSRAGRAICEALVDELTDWIERGFDSQAG